MSTSDDTPGILSPAQKRAMQTVVTGCATCDSYLDYLEQLGESDKELRERAAHLSSLASKALEIDRQSRR